MIQHMVKYATYDVTFREVPNEVSLTFAITGCTNFCKGCHSEHLRKDFGTELTYEHIDEILNKYSHLISVVTFLGGDHSLYIIDLIDHIKKTKPNLKICLYSGKARVHEHLLRRLDYVKVGPYIEELGPLNSPTTNQKFYILDGESKTDITHLFRTKI